jgi:hypothetical protein
MEDIEVNRETDPIPALRGRGKGEGLVERLLESRREDQQLDDLVATYAVFATVTPGKRRVRVVQEDPSDNMVLECALEGEADFIVSGDGHLLDLGTFQGIPIVNPAVFLKIVSQEKEKGGWQGMESHQRQRFSRDTFGFRAAARQWQRHPIRPDRIHVGLAFQPAKTGETFEPSLPLPGQREACCLP